MNFVKMATEEQLDIEADFIGEELSSEDNAKTKEDRE